jgi:hypothetical protein
MVSVKSNYAICSIIEKENEMMGNSRKNLQEMKFIELLRMLAIPGIIGVLAIVLHNIIYR